MRSASEHSVVSIRLEAEQYHRLKQIAQDSHRTMAGELRRLIDQRIAEADEKAAA